MIAAYDEPESGKTIANEPRKPLLRKSIRIDHIDLRELSKPNPAVPTFAPTVFDDTGKPMREQAMEDEAKSPAEKVRLSLVAFPNIALAEYDHAKGQNQSWLPFSATRTTIGSEIIQIPNAATYGAKVPQAAAQLIGWCEKSWMCDDARLRKLLSYTTNSEVLDTRDGRYYYRLEIKLISRVYMARHINVVRSVGGKVGSLAGTIAPTPQKPPPAENVAPAGDAEQPNEAPEISDQLAANEPDASADNKPYGSGAELSRAERTSLSLDSQSFVRPVVFGFKAITFSLEPSKPEPDQPEPVTQEGK